MGWDVVVGTVDLVLGAVFSLMLAVSLIVRRRRERGRDARR